MLAPNHIAAIEDQLESEIVGRLQQEGVGPNSGSFTLSEESQGTIKVRFFALGLIEFGLNMYSTETWVLTDVGRAVFFALEQDHN